MLTTLTVNIADPNANNPGDSLYAEIQEAVDAALFDSAAVMPGGSAR